MTSPRDAVSAILRAQHGLISRAQAREAGCSDDYIATRLRRSDWERVDRGVYRHHAVECSWHGRIMATCLALDAVASHRSAASLWGIEGYDNAPVEVTIPRFGGRNRPGVVVHESTQTDLLELAVREGIPCTEPARTLLDLAGVVSPLRLEWAIDDVLRRNLVTLSDLTGVLVKHCRKGRNGCGPLRALLEERAGTECVPGSTWSRMVARLLVSSGLPTPELEFPVQVNGRDYRIDLAYPDERVAIELDSVRWHLNRRSFEADPIRRNDLIVAGWEVLTFTYSFFHDRPERLCATVRAALKT